VICHFSTLFAMASLKLKAALQILKTYPSYSDSFNEGCISNCQVCAQLALEQGDVHQVSALWSQGASLYFDFDDLDDQEDQGAAALPETPSLPSKPRFVDGVVTLHIISAMTGEDLCTLTNMALSSNLRTIKERIERLEGTSLNMQKLFCLDGQVAQDHDLLVDLLSDGPPQLMFVRSSPRWAGLLEEIARGEVELQDLDEGARNDRGLVLAAVRASQGRALEYASWALCNDKARNSDPAGGEEIRSWPRLASNGRS